MVEFTCILSFQPLCIVFFVLLRLHLILRCAFVQREFSFCQTGREASSKIVEPLDGFFSPIPLSLTTFAVFVLTLSLSLPEFFPHWSFFLVFSFSPFFVRMRFLCFSSCLFCVGHFSVFSLNCELLLHMRVEKMRVYVKHIYTHCRASSSFTISRQNTRRHRCHRIPKCSLIIIFSLLMCHPQHCMK